MLSGRVPGSSGDIIIIWSSGDIIIISEKVNVSPGSLDDRTAKRRKR